MKACPNAQAKSRRDRPVLVAETLVGRSFRGAHPIDGRALCLADHQCQA